MQYKSNEDVIREIRAAAVREGLSLTGLAARIGSSQSNFSQLIHKKQLSFSDVSRIAAALGYSLHFKLVKDRQSGQPSAPSPASSPALPAADDLPGE